MKDIIVKNYKGKQKSATKAYQHDASRMANRGYYPKSQTWVAGSWGCPAFLIAGILCLALVGIFIFVYMLIVPPAGVLTVTYELRQKEVA